MPCHFGCTEPTLSATLYSALIPRAWVRRQSTYARAALLFFVVAFLTFMSIAAFPAFVEDMRVRGAQL